MSPLVVFTVFGSSFHPDVPEGFVGVVAAPSERRSYAARRSFLMPAVEYERLRRAGRVVVDPSRFVEVADLVDRYRRT